jgi:hypothetical protein
MNLRGIVEDLLLKLWLFRMLLGIDAIICAIIVVFFFIGMVSGSVSSYNIGLWIAILAALAVIFGVSLWLKMLGYTVFGTLLLLVIAIPGLLYGLFIFLTIVTKTSWN